MAAPAAAASQIPIETKLVEDTREGGVLDMVSQGGMKKLHHSNPLYI